MSHCASLRPTATFLPPTHSPFLSLSRSYFPLSPSLRHPHPLSVFFLCLTPSVESGAVLNRGLFVHKHVLSWRLPYLLVSRAAVALLCVTAQPCLFSLPGSCLSWLWTSFKACPVSAPRQTHTHTHKHSEGRAHTSIKTVFTSQRIHTVPMWAGNKCTHTNLIIICPTFVASAWLGWSCT